MSRNMSTRDRVLRAFLVAPAAIVVGTLVGPASALAIVLYLLAGVMVATAAVGTCPLYTLVHLGTRAARPQAH